MKKKLHTPEGVRDIYNVECGKKLALESRLKKVFHLYGYHDIQTPTIEYFDVFREEIGTTPANDSDPSVLYRQYICEPFQLSGTLKRDDADGRRICRG
mgnify:CR=1 FL=1